MLLPALTNARIKAKNIGCLNNLRQMGLAQMEYSSDHDDLILQPGDTSWPFYVTLSEYGCKYFGSQTAKGTFACPNEPIGFGSYTVGLFRYTHYAVNDMMCSNEVLRKLSSLISSSQATLIIDSGRRSTFKLNYYSLMAFRHGTVNYIDASTSNLNYGYPTCTAPAHILFVDGHATGWRIQELHAVAINQFELTNAVLRRGYRP